MVRFHVTRTGILAVVYCFCFLCFYFVFEFKPTGVVTPTSSEHTDTNVTVRCWSKERSLFRRPDLPKESFHLNVKKCFIPGFVQTIIHSNQSKYLAAVKLQSSPTMRLGKPFDSGISSMSTSNGASLKLNLAKIHNVSLILCCWRKFLNLEVNYYHRITGLNTSRKCTPLNLNMSVSIENQNMVTVECFRNESTKIPKIIYQNVHFNTPSQGPLNSFWKKFEKQSKTPKPPNVFIIGVDRLSQASLQKYLPKSFKILTSSKKPFTNFKGFASLGHNSPLDSLVPFLTAKSYKYWSKNCNPNEIPEDKPKNVKDCDMGIIFKYFQSLKYQTGFAEEIQLKSAVPNPANNQIFDIPDHNFDLHSLHVNSKNKVTFNTFQVAKLFSNQTLNPTKAVFEYGINFFAKFSKRIPTFTFLWLKNYLRDVRAFDAHLSNTLLKILKSYESKNTFIILLSGRGSEAFHHEMDYIEFKLDQYLPVLFIRLPPKVHQIESRFQSLLNTNSARLTSPFDVHETLKSIISLGVNFIVNSGVQDILDTMGDVKTNQLESLKLYGVSLFAQEVSIDRTCASLGIPNDFCPCSDNSKLLPSRSFIVSSIVSNYGLEVANQELSQDSEYKSLCSNWGYEKHLYTQIIVSKNNYNYELVQLTFKANPGSNIFRIQCKFQVKSMSFSCDTLSFTRLTYANPLERYCIEESLFSFNPTFCYCNEF